MNITPLETTYGGIRYRSRTEARWAVFFDCAGIRYQYEAEGFLIRTGCYLPDFWLPGLGFFFEVKGGEPTDDEVEKCKALSETPGAEMLLAAGPPEERWQLLWFQGGEQREGRYIIARDRIVEAGFWLVGMEDCTPITAPLFTAERQGPMFSGSLEDAYLAAQAERFEGVRRRRRFQPLPDEAGRHAA
jgi:hypothetical protein